MPYSKILMKTKTKQKTGWVIRNLKTGRYFTAGGRYEYTTKIERASIIPNREDARGIRFLGEETVNKVALDKNLRATKVIAGNGPNCRF